MEERVKVIDDFDFMQENTFNEDLGYNPKSREKIIEISEINTPSKCQISLIIK